MSKQELSSFESRWLAQAIAEVECRSGRFPDQDEVREATATETDMERWIVARGVLLADREGLVENLHRWLSISRTLILSLAVLIFFTGGVSALGLEEADTRQINVLWALLALMAPNLIMLMIWAVGFVSAGRRHIGIGALWQWVISHFPGKASELVQPFLTLHDMAGLTRWWFGSITHGLWAIATLGMLVSLVVALAFKNYSFIWETTWLTQDALVSTVHFFGTLPALFGFPIPDESILSRSSVPLTDEAARRAWTAWFIGCLTVYGFLPRLLLWLLCWVQLSFGRNRLRLDLTNREYGIVVRLAASSSDDDREQTMSQSNSLAREIAPREIAISPMQAHTLDQSEDAVKNPKGSTQAERFKALRERRLEKLPSIHGRAENHDAQATSKDFGLNKKVGPKNDVENGSPKGQWRIWFIRLLIAYIRLPKTLFFLPLAPFVIFSVFYPWLWVLSLGMFVGLIFARHRRVRFLVKMERFAGIARKPLP